MKSAYFHNGQPKVYLTQDTRVGGKFWECTAYPDKVIVRWGPRNAQGQQREYPPSICTNHDTIWDLMVRAEGKINKGYQMIWAKSYLPQVC